VPVTMADLKEQLAALPGNASDKATVERWATNTLQGVPDEILPRVPARARAAIERLARLCESVGPRILETTAFGTIGDINWGTTGKSADETAELDDLLEGEYDLEMLANELLRQGKVRGIMAAIVRRDADDPAIVTMEPLLGHVELVYGHGQRVVGLLQAWTETVTTAAGTKRLWSVRVYDYDDRAMRQWDGLESPIKAVKAAPDDEVGPSPQYPEGAPMPRYIVLRRHPETLQPLGDMETLLPLIQSDWSSQLRGDRAEENTAFPQLKLKGKAEDATDERSTSHIIRVPADGDASFIDPGDLRQLHTHHDRKLERLREDANMPGAFFGSQTPSGEALRERNQKYIAHCQYLSKRLTRLLTALVRDLTAMLGLGDDISVSVQINREYTKASEIETIVLLYDKELLPFDAAVRAISVYVPTWPPAAVEEWVARRGAPLTSRPPLPSFTLPQDEEPQARGVEA
jgi:hypothetical protein